MASMDGEIPAIWFLITAIGFIFLSVIQYIKTNKSLETIFLSCFAFLFLLSYFLLSLFTKQ
jgi:hypothetical protein